ncbi:hypothetical protein PG984_015076 [Apiospora sp. TS-2023a]
MRGQEALDPAGGKLVDENTGTLTRNIVQQWRWPAGKLSMGRDACEASMLASTHGSLHQLLVERKELRLQKSVQQHSCKNL